MLFLLLGDNMLTALSVARDCGMVGENQKIILVQAFPGTTGKNDPWLEYMYTEDPQDHHQKSTVRKSLSLSLSSYHIMSLFSWFDMEIYWKWNAFFFPQKETKIAMPDSTDSNYHFALDGRSWAIIRKHFPLTLQKVC